MNLHVYILYPLLIYPLFRQVQSADLATSLLVAMEAVAVSCLIQLILMVLGN